MTRILIIDDDEDDCDLFIDAVQVVDSAADCVKAFNGKNAIELLSTEYKPDFIFLDINMPVFDGKWCLNAINNLQNMVGIPVIIYTTSKRKADIEDTKNLGAVYFITKPSSLTELCAEITFVFNKGWERPAA
jgi:CheY-like chemotaxis protein